MSLGSTGKPLPNGTRRSRQSGQGLVEFALILALVAVLAISATTFLGKQVAGSLSTVGAQIGASVTRGVSQPAPTLTPVPTRTPSPTRKPASAYTTKTTCVAAGYKWYTTAPKCR
ncbi:MAG: hypothetical protein ABI555_02720 [Chloroflexota bacterium]